MYNNEGTSSDEFDKTPIHFLSCFCWNSFQNSPRLFSRTYLIMKRITTMWCDVYKWFYFHYLLVFYKSGTNQSKQQKCFIQIRQFRWESKLEAIQCIGGFCDILHQSIIYNKLRQTCLASYLHIFSRKQSLLTNRIDAFIPIIVFVLKKQLHLLSRWVLWKHFKEHCFKETSPEEWKLQLNNMESESINSFWTRFSSWYYRCRCRNSATFWSVFGF